MSSDRDYSKSVHLVIRRTGIGDTVAASALVRDLKTTFPDIRISVSGRDVGPVFAFDARVSSDPLAPTVVLDHKSAVQRAHRDPDARYLYALHEEFEQQTGLRIKRGRPIPDLVLSPLEQTRPILEPYYVIAPGVKNDIPVKNWGPSEFQKVVDGTCTWQWVQVGDTMTGRVSNRNPDLTGVRDMRGRTTIRDLFRLIAHAEAVLCHVSLPMLVAASFGVPCVAVAGGRETPSLFSDLGVRFIHTVGELDCCTVGGCLAAAALPDKGPNDFPFGWLCKDPITGDDGTAVGRCMSLITPGTVIAELVAAKRRGRNPSTYPDGTLPSAPARSLPVVATGPDAV